MAPHAGPTLLLLPRWRSTCPSRYRAVPCAREGRAPHRVHCVQPGWARAPCQTCPIAVERVGSLYSGPRITHGGCVSPLMSVCRRVAVCPQGGIVGKWEGGGRQRNGKVSSYRGCKQPGSRSRVVTPRVRVAGSGCGDAPAACPNLSWGRARCPSLTIARGQLRLPAFPPKAKTHALLEWDWVCFNLVYLG